MGEKHPHILSGMLGYAPKLVRLEGAILDPVILHMAEEHFFHEFAKGVQQYYGAKQLGS